MDGHARSPLPRTRGGPRCAAARRLRIPRGPEAGRLAEITRRGGDERVRGNDLRRRAVLGGPRKRRTSDRAAYVGRPARDRRARAGECRHAPQLRHELRGGRILAWTHPDEASGWRAAKAAARRRRLPLSAPVRRRLDSLQRRKRRPQRGRLCRPPRAGPRRTRGLRAGAGGLRDLARTHHSSISPHAVRLRRTDGTCGSTTVRCAH